MDAQLAQHKRRCLIGLLVAEAAPPEGGSPARNGTHFCTAFPVPASPPGAVVAAPAGAADTVTEAASHADLATADGAAAAAAASAAHLPASAAAMAREELQRQLDLAQQAPSTSGNVQH